MLMGHQMSLDIKHSVVWNRTTFSPEVFPSCPGTTGVFTHSSWRTIPDDDEFTRKEIFGTHHHRRIFRLDARCWEDWSRLEQPDLFTVKLVKNLKPSNLFC